jgi:hypothetical protein
LLRLRSALGTGIIVCVFTRTLVLPALFGSGRPGAPPTKAAQRRKGL